VFCYLDTDRQSMDGVRRGLLGQPDGRAMRAGMSRRITGLARSPAVGGQDLAVMRFGAPIAGPTQ
jgi:hypothetical protein